MKRIVRSLSGRLRGLRAGLPLNPAALAELVREQLGVHRPAGTHAPHLREALDWLVRAQDATPDDGFARAYGLAWHPYFGRRGWQASYPETTGYIIPTLYMASRFLEEPDLARRAERAARWECSIQLETGAVRGGIMGEPTSPAVFNTGQVLFGWLAALDETGDPVFGEAAGSAGDWLLSVLDDDGFWRRGGSRFARTEGTPSLYNSRTAWGLAAAGVVLEREDFLEGASRNLRSVAARVHENGWIPDCCLTDRTRPLLHTIAYAIRGLLEGGLLLDDPGLVDVAARSAGALLGTVRGDGWMPGRLGADWSPAAGWSCLTGEAQMANVWLRLHAVTGDSSWLRPLPAVLHFIESTQNRSSRNGGLRGGIKGSFPLTGAYNPGQLPNWATKFFVDAVIRWEGVRRGGCGGDARLSERLA